MAVNIMKKLIFVITTVFVLGSCDQKQEEDSGLGELRLGANFESLPFSKDFDKYMDDEYFIQSFKLSDEIGYVSNLNVTTDQGNISEIRFSSSEETKTAELDKLHSQMIEQKTAAMPMLANMKLPETKLYISADSATIVSVIEKGSKRKGVAIKEYQYTSRDAVMKKIAEKRRELGL